jgi:SpoVK/Ycf46/Vps4 family AAA+-type ATPase
MQLVFLTNYPHEFPPAILSRVSEFIEFDKPGFETQRALFKEHLSRAAAVSKKKIGSIEAYLSVLDEELCAGLVGRDIEAICLKLFLAPYFSPDKLRENIRAYKAQRERLAAFVHQGQEPKKKEEDKLPKGTPQERKEKDYFQK